MATPYENLARQATLDAFDPAFYDKVLTDDRVSRFFKGVDMDRQGLMLNAFLTMRFGESDAYAGKFLLQGHRHLVEQSLNDEHFDAVAGHIKLEEAVAPQGADTTEEPVADGAEGSSVEGPGATPVKIPRARKTAGTVASRR